MQVEKLTVNHKKARYGMNFRISDVWNQDDTGTGNGPKFGDEVVREQNVAPVMIRNVIIIVIIVISDTKLNFDLYVYRRKYISMEKIRV